MPPMAARIVTRRPIRSAASAATDRSVLGRTEFDDNVLALDVTSFVQTPAESVMRKASAVPSVRVNNGPPGTSLSHTNRPGQAQQSQSRDQSPHRRGQRRRDSDEAAALLPVISSARRGPSPPTT